LFQVSAGVLWLGLDKQQSSADFRRIVPAD